MSEDASIIRLQQIEKVYHLGEADVRAVDGVSLDIRVGEFIAVMGASGSGKSTLMNIIGCLDQPTSGRYFLAGKEVSGYKPAELAGIRNKMIGFVFQNFNLLPRTTALENVELPLLYSDVSSLERKHLAKEALRRVGLEGRVHHHPNQMSGGQQQRTAIARAIVASPKILLADEPTGNLDSRTSIEIMSLFQDLNRSGITVALVTHEPDIARFTSRIVIMKDGIVATDKTQTPLDAKRSLSLAEAS